MGRFEAPVPHGVVVHHTFAARNPGDPPQESAAAGPRTIIGKGISSRNRLTHGLATDTDKLQLLPREEQSDFDDLLSALLAEHQPATPTECILVKRMTHHEWLYRRALRLQEEAFICGSRNIVDEKKFSLYMRYATMHERRIVRKSTRKDRISRLTQLINAATQ